VLAVTPSPKWSHQRVLGELHIRIRGWLADHPELDVLFSPADLSLGEDEILQPDLFVYRTPSTGQETTWRDITSLVLVIEVSSPSTAHYDRHLKCKRYQRAGVDEYWIVDPDARTVERWRPGDEVPEVATDTLVWRFGDRGPAHVLKLDEIFEKA
jgi:Uma2 family endonuclease